MIVLTCEHASNTVPARYRALFDAGLSGDAGGRDTGPDVLSTHRGYDIGALVVARHLEKLLDAPLFSGRVTRLLVDLNRSAGNPSVFSPFSRALPMAARARLLHAYHAPFRAAVRERIEAMLREAPQVWHISVHSHTPELDGKVRNNAVGILYDPARRGEVGLAVALQTSLRERQRSWHIRFNYPYRGTGDGHVTALRAAFSAGRYVGIELEINQRLLSNARAARTVASLLGEALVEVLPGRTRARRGSLG